MTKPHNLKKCTVYVGIDQSMNSTGYYINYPHNGERKIDKGLIKPGSRREGSRLKYIYDKLFKLLDRFNGADVVVCMEGYAYEYRKGRVFELGEVGGIVKLCCQTLGVRVVAVPPTELKKFVTGRGSSSKKQMMTTLRENQDDIADAKGLAMIAEELVVRKSTLRHQLEVVCNCLKNRKVVSSPRSFVANKLKRF